MRRAAAGGLLGMAASILKGRSVAEAAETEGGQKEKEVRLEHLRPKEIEAAMDACPVLFQPLGTIEWHGRHSVVGVDSLKAHMLCACAARQSGGLVAPPVYGGIGGLDQPHTFVMEKENELFSVLLRPWLQQLTREAVRQGFKAVIFLTGHYGAGQQIVVREAAVRMSRVLGVPILGTPEYLLALDEDYFGDHAAWGETSLMMYLDPPSVDLSQLGDPPHQGVGGRDPKEHASAEDGELLAKTIVGRLAALARQMPDWDGETLQRFIDAESALVDRQIAMAADTGNTWAAWRNISKGVFSDYGKFLVERKFDKIVAMIERL